MCQPSALTGWEKDTATSYFAPSPAAAAQGLWLHPFPALLALCMGTCSGTPGEPDSCWVISRVGWSSRDSLVCALSAVGR